jgi:hypothetical protein
MTWKSWTGSAWVEAPQLKCTAWTPPPPGLKLEGGSLPGAAAEMKVDEDGEMEEEEKEGTTANQSASEGMLAEHVRVVHELELCGEVVSWVSADGVDGVGRIRLTDPAPLLGLRWAAGDTTPAEGTELVNDALASAVLRAARMHAKFGAACAKGTVETVSTGRAPHSVVTDASPDCTPTALVMLHTDEIHAMGMRGIRSDAYIRTQTEIALRLQAPAGVWDSALKSVLSQVHPDHVLQPEATALLGAATTEVLARLLSRSSTNPQAAFEPLDVSIEQPFVALGLPPTVQLAAPTPPTPLTMASMAAPLLKSDLRCVVGEEAVRRALVGTKDDSGGLLGDGIFTGELAKHVDSEIEKARQKVEKSGQSVVEALGANIGIAAVPPPPPLQLPPGWEQRVDERSKKIFVDHNTCTTSWEDPRTAKPRPAAVDPRVVAAIAGPAFALQPEAALALAVILEYMMGEVLELASRNQLGFGARGQRAIMDDLVRDAIYKILKPLQSWNNISRKEAERIEDDVAESVSFAF